MKGENALDIINKKYPLSPVSFPQWEKLKINGMHFDIRAYKAEGLGHVSLMKAEGFFSLMKMESLIVVPYALDMPIYSSDKIDLMKETTLIIELYDTMLSSYDSASLSSIKEKYSFLKKKEMKEAWYDSIKLKESLAVKDKARKEIESLSEEYLEAFISSKAEAATDEKEKKKKIDDYVSSLLSNGGVSTDIFKKKLGEEKTGELFSKVLFGNA